VLNINSATVKYSKPDIKFSTPISSRVTWLSSQLHKFSQINSKNLFTSRLGLLKVLYSCKNDTVSWECTLPPKITSLRERAFSFSDVYSVIHFGLMSHSFQRDQAVKRPPNLFTNQGNEHAFVPLVLSIIKQSIYGLACSCSFAR
jgi:hypothetical protein